MGTPGFCVGNSLIRVDGAVDIATPVIPSGRDHVDGDRERHVAVQLGRQLVLADRLDRIAVELAPLEVDAGLLAHRVDDVGRR